MACIYKITNLVNGKMYVGQTKGTLAHRWGQHRAEGNSQRDHHQYQTLYRAMRKYGVENFEIELLQECTEEELNALEIYWIGRLDTYRNGYNMTIGGITMRTKPKETIMDRRRPVEQYTLQGEYIARYESIAEASRQLNIHPRLIGSCCRRNQHTAGGYIFCYEGDKDRIDEQKGNLLRMNKNAFYVKQYTLNGEFIKEYASAHEASDAVGVSVTRICSCCRGEQRKSGGYQWCYRGQEYRIKQ